MDNSEEFIKTLIDSALVSYGQFSAFIWNKVLKDAKFFTSSNDRKNDHGWGKDSTNSIIGVGGTLAKDRMQQLTQQIQNGWSLQNLAGNWSLNLLDTMEDYLIGIQSGQSNQTQILEDALGGGTYSCRANQHHYPWNKSPHVLIVLLFSGTESPSVGVSVFRQASEQTSRDTIETTLA